MIKIFLKPGVRFQQCNSCLIISSGGNNILILSSTTNKKISYSTDPVTESNFVNTSNTFNSMLSTDLTSAVDNDIVAFSNDKIFIYENNDDGSLVKSIVIILVRQVMRLEK